MTTATTTMMLPHQVQAFARAQAVQANATIVRLTEQRQALAYALHAGDESAEHKLTQVEQAIAMEQKRHDRAVLAEEEALRRHRVAAPDRRRDVLMELDRLLAKQEREADDLIRDLRAAQAASEGQGFSDPAQSTLAIAERAVASFRLSYGMAHDLAARLKGIDHPDAGKYLRQWTIRERLGETLASRIPSLMPHAPKPVMQRPPEWTRLLGELS